MITDDFLEMLRCPESRAPLKRANSDLVAKLNQAIAAGRLRSRAGQALGKPIDGLLIRDDGLVGYPIVDDIPILLVDEGIELGGFITPDDRMRS